MMKRIELNTEHILGMSVATIVWGSIQTFVTAFLFMLLMGVVHESLSDAVFALGYGDSLIILVIVEAILIILRISVDYRDALALSKKLTQPESNTNKE